MAKAKRRAKPRRTSSAGRPAGGKLGAGRGKPPARAGAVAARKAPAAAKATGKVPAKKAAPVRASSGKTPKPPEVKRTVKPTGGSSGSKVSASRGKAIGGTRPDSAGSTGLGSSGPAKAARKADVRPASPGGAASDAHRPSSERSASEKSSETTAQGFAPAAPEAVSEGQHNAGAPAELPVPIASFTI